MKYGFENFTLDTDRYQLSNAGKEISVEPLVFDLLVYLIEHRERVVTRSELLENLWQGKVVTDAALAARIRDARKAVRDSGTKQNLLSQKGQCHLKPDKRFDTDPYEFSAKIGFPSAINHTEVQNR